MLLNFITLKLKIVYQKTPVRVKKQPARAKKVSVTSTKKKMAHIQNIKNYHKSVRKKTDNQ